MFSFHFFQRVSLWQRSPSKEQPTDRSEKWKLMLVCPELSTTQNRSIAQLLPPKSMGYVSACEVTDLMLYPMEQSCRTLILMMIKMISTCICSSSLLGIKDSQNWLVNANGLVNIADEAIYLLVLPRRLWALWNIECQCYVLLLMALLMVW